MYLDATSKSEYLEAIQALILHFVTHKMGMDSTLLANWEMDLKPVVQSTESLLEEPKIKMWLGYI